MRNLVLLNRGQIRPESLTYPDLTPIDSVFDAVSDTVTVALSSKESNIIEVQQFMKNGQVQVLASFPAPEASLLSFNHFADSALLVFVFSNGDLITAQYDSGSPDYDNTAVELVGSIDSGLSASCWSPDEEVLAILTKEQSLVLLSRQFDPISEKTLDSNDILVADAKHVSVGWGTEETQFKGKGFKALEREREAIRHAGGGNLDLKEDTELRDPTVAQAQKGTISEFDTGSVHISWRGDCEYFAVSTMEDALVESSMEVIRRRVVRVFNREGELDSVSEAADGLEHNLAWRPSGSLIASTQRCQDIDGDDVLQVSFFERNGLRHGEFNSRLNPYEETVLNMEWSCNSEMLAFQMKDRVLIWTTKNYHWYLKQELFVNRDDPANEVLYIKFHPEKPLQLMVGTSKGGICMLNFAHKIASGPTILGKDIGMTIVIDGTEAKVTPLGVANVPPPIAFRDYDFESPITDVAVNSSNDVFAVCTSQNDVFVSSISVAEMKQGKLPKVAKICGLSIASPEEFVKQVSFIDDHALAVLIDTPSSSRVDLYNISNIEVPFASTSLEARAVMIKARSDFKTAVVECIDGSLFEVSVDGSVSYLATFPSLCHEFEVSMVDNDGTGLTPVALGISSNGKLFANNTNIASGITSMKVTQDHLAITNAHSQLCFVHLKNVLEPSTFSFLQDQKSSSDERMRQIERGSILVSCIPSKYSVVLQAPRGNLETICPRIMVLTGVRQFIASMKYQEAFLACRTHRIDLDLLHDYDPVLFHSHVELFIKQIGRVDYLDLFVSCLHEEDVTKTKYRDTLNELDISKLSLEPSGNVGTGGVAKKGTTKTAAKSSSKINKICNAVLEVLSGPQYESGFLQTRVTAYACQSPPNLVGALSLISSLKNEDEHEKAITHLCFLADVNKLYNHALEIYDVKMALNVAQKSQKDPKEYLPFLQNLHVQTPLRRQFLIDDHLKHHTKALGWLHELGEDAEAELDDYVVKHALYKDALAIYRYNDTRNKQILALYAEQLTEDKKHNEAGAIFEFLGSQERALESYVLSKRWEEALAMAQTLADEKILVSTAHKLSGLLVDDHRYSEAAEVELRVLRNVENAVKLKCKSYRFDSAILLALEQNQPALIDEVVDVQLDEGFGVIAELIADCTSQANSQLKRLRELRQKKEENPYAFYGIPNDDLDTPDNVSVAASEASTTPSFFTKYTGKTAGTAKTGASRKTTKNKKREERKRAQGRKGTIYEEEYLIKSVGRLVERLDQTEADALRLVEALVRRHKMLQAHQIQNNWAKLTLFLKDNIDEIHSMSEKDRERIDDNGEVYLIEEIVAPKIREFPKLEMLDY